MTQIQKRHAAEPSDGSKWLLPHSKQEEHGRRSLGPVERTLTKLMSRISQSPSGIPWHIIPAGLPSGLAIKYYILDEAKETRMNVLCMPSISQSAALNFCVVWDSYCANGVQNLLRNSVVLISRLL